MASTPAATRSDASAVPGVVASTSRVIYLAVRMRSNRVFADQAGWRAIYLHREAPDV
jgi:hypothetical protein